MKLIRTACVLAAGFLALVFQVRPCVAGEAFFTLDGSAVIMGLCGQRTGLVQVDLATGAITDAPLPKELKDECIESVARGGEGEALFLAKNAVWVWTPGAATPVKRVCATAPVENPMDLFVATKPGAPLVDCLFVSSGTLFARKPGGKTFLSIFCRRVENASGGVFSEDGRFFFVSGGDVWEGGIEPYDDPDIDRLGVLVGARIAPLGILNTDEGNSGGMWVNHIAPAGPWLYVHLRGRHLATILRTPLPPKPLYAPGTVDFPTTKAQIDAMAQSLGKTEILVDDLDFARGFCATEVAGKPRVFFCSRVDDRGISMLLWEGAGKPRVIGLLPE